MYQYNVTELERKLKIKDLKGKVRKVTWIF